MLILAAGFFSPDLPVVSEVHGQSDPAAPDVEFPAPGISNWLCVPPDFAKGPKRDLATAGKETRRVDWVRPPITLDELTAGLRMVEEAPGSRVLAWENLPRYPTICTEAVPEDWIGEQSIELDLTSAGATGDRLTLGVLADNPKTGDQDFFIKDFKVDWSGKKTLAFSLSSFKKFREPLDWTGVKGLYLFSNAKGTSPDPATGLHIRAVRLSQRQVPDLESVETKDEIEFVPRFSNIWEEPHALNKPGREIVTPMKPGEPIVRQYFKQNSRAQFGYYPHYNPGYVSTDPKGRPFIRTTDRIQWLDDAGIWHEKSLLEPIREFAAARKWKQFGILTKEADPTIRFDSSGAVYVIVQVESEGKWNNQIPLLLYAPDVKQPWKWLELPGARADFEKLGAGNQEALDKPPVLSLISSRLNTDKADRQTRAYLVTLEKKEDGTIAFPRPASIGNGKAEEVIMGPTHDGKGNLLISRKGKIYAAYGSCPSKEDPDRKNIWKRPKDPVWWESIGIPEDHPANKMMLDPVRLTEFGASPCSGGVPVFVRAYDRATGAFEKPVFVGYGGRDRDVHNTPAMTVDSKGIFHLILMGHNDPALYSHTLQPDDISEWTVPAPINMAPDKNYGCRASYPALTCDRNDNLHFMFRSASEVYNHRLSIISKDAGKETWNTERSVFVPLTDSYHVWAHALAYDPVRDHLYLCYFEGWGDGGTPDLEAFWRFRVPPGSPAEGVILISKDSGKTWSHATTPDFLNK